MKNLKNHRFTFDFFLENKTSTIIFIKKTKKIVHIFVLVFKSMRFRLQIVQKFHGKDAVKVDNGGYDSLPTILKRFFLI